MQRYNQGAYAYFSMRIINSLNELDEIIKELDDAVKVSDDALRAPRKKRFLFVSDVHKKMPFGKC